MTRKFIAAWAFAAALGFAFLFTALPRDAHSQSCHTLEMLLASFKASTQRLGAHSKIIMHGKDDQNFSVYYTLKRDPAHVLLSMFDSGCLVVAPGNRLGIVLPVNPKIIENMEQGEVIAEFNFMSNGGI